jgi:hypothetical protein
MDYYKGTIPILDDEPECQEMFFPQGTDKDAMLEYAYGYVPRDYEQYPEEMFASPSDMDLYDESEWDALYDAQEANESSLEHLFLRGGKPAFVNLDQNGNGYCWAYSTGHSIMMSMLADHRPLIRMNPHSTASIVKNGADQGGWCGLSAQSVREIGMCPEGTGEGQWPLHSRDYRRYYTEAAKAEMAKYKITEDYVDLTRQVYNQNLTTKQLATCLFNNLACPNDFNHWGHSVCSIRWVRVERGSWGNLILNSWKGWGRFGLAVLRGTKAIPNGAVCTRNVGRKHIITPALAT